MGKKQSPYWLRTKFPCIVKQTGKHDSAYYIANSHDELCQIFYNIFQLHNEYGFYYTLNADEYIWYQTIEQADEITKHFRELWDFIMSRSNAEYEKVQIVQPEKF